MNQFIVIQLSILLFSDWFNSFQAILVFLIFSSILLLIYQYFELKRNKLESKLLEVRLVEQKERLKKLKEELAQTKESNQSLKKDLQISSEEVDLLGVFLKKAQKIQKETSSQLNKYLRHIARDSNYALKIQEAVLPSTEELQNDFKDYFLIYKPKAKVSGDFYWLGKEGNSTYVALVDCTGHDVPGAYMGMLANSFLNRIINEMKESDPSKILTLMDNFLIDALRQTEGNNRDRMSLGICKIDKLEDGKSQIVFSGARIPFFYCKKGLEFIQRRRGDRHSIGGTNRQEKSFTDQEVILQPGDCFYLATDGFIDQNDPQRNRFGSKRLMNALFNQFGKPMEYQKITLETLLQAHQEEEAQRDDITMIGVEI